MAVKLILVFLVVLFTSLAWAQQSRETGGSDRRISLRRFSSRRKVENTRNAGRVKAPAEILAKRKQLFQRNPSRSRTIGRGDKKQIESGRRNTLRVTTTTTEAYIDVDPLVEKISNSDRNIIDLILDNDKLKNEVDTPFKGVSEVRTVSSPSGFRSSNEQIVRVSFKKTTTARPVTRPNNNLRNEHIDQIQEQKDTTTQKPRRNPGVNVTPRRRLGIRRRGQKPASNARKVSGANPVEVPGASDPLKALLKTANEPVGTTEATKVVDNNNKVSEDVEAAIREMKEDNRIEKPKSRSRGNNPRRLSGSSRKNIRLNLRGRNGQRKTAQPVETRNQSSFRSFPSRQGSGTGTTNQKISDTPTTRPTPRQRFETRPSVLPAQTEVEPSQFFSQFDLPVNQPDQFNLVTEAPRSAFQLEQNFVGNRFSENQVQVQTVQQQNKLVNSSPQRFEQKVQAPQQFQQSAQSPQQFQQAVQAPQRFQQAVQVPQRFQPASPLRTQPTPQVQQNPIPTHSVNGQQQVLSQNPFNLLNTNNFHAFDAQFGGSVPTNPGASRLSSSIFAQPQTALLQGRDVLVNPRNGFQATPLQPGQAFQQQDAPQQVFQQQAAPTQAFQQQAAPQQVFQQQAAPQQVFQQAGRSIQQAAPQFTNQNFQPASFSGHPATDINLQTGSFNLRTG